MEDDNYHVLVLLNHLHNRSCLNDHDPIIIALAIFLCSKRNRRCDEPWRDFKKSSWLSALVKRSRKLGPIVDARITVEKVSKEGPRAQRNQWILSVSSIGWPMAVIDNWSQIPLNFLLNSATDELPLVVWWSWSRRFYHVGSIHVQQKNYYKPIQEQARYHEQ